ncbi:MAG: fumarate hydratase, partial [Chloroflexi bacterium]|nr:fumarate hydratase [Chloroflexota bacterium]
MEEQQVSSETIYQMMYGAITRAATIIPRDVKEALIAGLAKEQSPMARRQIETTLENLDAAEKTRGLACGDTGFPLFFVQMGDAIHIEGGLSTLRGSAERAVREATQQSKLRSTMVHPLTRKNPGDNVGRNLPAIEIRSAPSLAGLE